MTPLVPRRPKLAEALAACFDADAREVADRLASGEIAAVTERGVVRREGGARDWRVVSPAAAWERLAARRVIPPAWLSDRQRAFVDPFADLSVSYHGPEGADGDMAFTIEAVTQAGYRWKLSDRVAGHELRSAAHPHRRLASAIEAAEDKLRVAARARLLPDPPTILACCLLAADPEGVAAAEAIARNAAVCGPSRDPQSRRVVWREPRSPRVAWHVLDPAATARERTRLQGPFATPGPWHRLVALGYALEVRTADAVVLACPAIELAAAGGTRCASG